MLGVVSLLGIYVAVFVLYAVMPGRWVTGYAVDSSGQPLRYHLNGLLVFAAVVGGYAALAASGMLPWDFIGCRSRFASRSLA